MKSITTDEMLEAIMVTGEDSEHYDNEDSHDDESSADDDDRSDCDSYSDLNWLEAIDAKVTSTSTLDERGEPKNVAYCMAKLIRRDRICYEYYAEMKKPSQETSMLAFDLFDRYGRGHSLFSFTQPP